MSLQNRMLWQTRGRGALIAILLLAACMCFFPLRMEAANAPLAGQAGLLSEEEGESNAPLAGQAGLLSEEEGESNAPLAGQAELLSEEEGESNAPLAGQAELLSEEEGKSNAPLTDQAGLLSEEEKEEISRQIEELEKATGWDIMAVTTDDAEGMDGEAYAEAWFDEHTQKDDGVICAIDMDNREITVRAFGEAMFYINDDRTERILDAGYDRIAHEQYGGTLKAMLAETALAYEEENPKNNYLYDEDTRKVTSYGKAHRGISWMEVLIAALAAVLAGGITAGAIIGKYRLKFGGYKYPIEKNGSAELKLQKDQLVNQFVTHRHIPREDSGSSGGSNRSTIHTGAGGRSSSGGSRKF